MKIQVLIEIALKYMTAILIQVIECKVGKQIIKDYLRIKIVEVDIKVAVLTYRKAKTN